MYKIYDYYEGRQLVAECEDFESMKKAKKEYIADTDGECDLEVVLSTRNSQRNQLAEKCLRPFKSLDYDVYSTFKCGYLLVYLLLLQ